MEEQQIFLQPEMAVIGGGAVSSVNGYTGDVVLTTSDLENTSDYQTGSEVAAAISNEATAREAADNNLQTQIDGLSASSDVTDIVGTYAELQNYDTSTLGDNDIIKVLQDESRNGETTYYRWSTTTQSFTLIGEEGPYYTKAQADVLLNAKQDTLTAGANIQISNNTISATDTTYSDFTGTDGTTAGTAGLVPAPATTDAGKYLKADGTWDSVQAGPTVVQTTGTSITDVMSQKAVTDELFNGNNRNMVQIGNNASSTGGSYFESIAIGRNAKATAQSSTAIGPIGPVANAKYSLAIGYSTSATNDSATAIGNQAQATYKGSVGLGAYSKPLAVGEVNVGSTDTTCGYNSSNYRLLTGLYDGQSAHDAVTLGQLNTRMGGLTIVSISQTDYDALATKDPNTLYVITGA